MKRFDSPALSALGAVVLSTWFAACGGLDDGAITIVDAGGSGGSLANNGGSNPSGGSSGSSSEGGEGGEPPVVISDDPPVVVSVTPDDEASDIEPDEAIEIEFSETLDPDTVTGETIVVRDGDRIVSGELEFSGVTATFTPDERLTLLAHVSVTVSTDVTDLEGIAMEEAFVSSYRVRDGAWGHKIVLNNAEGDLDADFVPAPAMDSRGNALAVWTQTSETNPMLYYVIWGRFFTPGVGWSDAFPISTDGTESFSPALAMDPNGDAIVSWVQRDGSYQRVYARRYVAGVWEESPQRVDGTDHDSVEAVAAAVSPGGEMHVAWTGYSSLSMYRTIYGNQADGFESWDTTDTYRYGSYEDVGGPTLAFDPEGNGFMVWFADDGTNPVDVRVGRYVKGAATPWKSPNPIPAGVGVPSIYNNVPAIVADEEGGAMVVWRTNSSEVTSSRFTKAAGWSEAMPVDAGADGVNWGPRLARVGDEFVATWVQDVESVTNTFSNRYADGAWQAEPSLLTNGDTSVFYWTGLGFGLDRNGNGVAAWAQDDVRFARLIGETGMWQADAELDSPMNDSDVPGMEVDATVAANGVATATYVGGYPYGERHDIVYVAAFE
jgi:hypothetical protein